MAEKRVPDFDDGRVLQEAIEAEFQKNEDIVEYIQQDSLEVLKARYAEAQEDESLRNEGFGLAQKNGSVRKPRSEKLDGSYYAAQPLPNKDDIGVDGAGSLKEIFGSAQSEFDADSISFGDIELDAQATDDESTAKNDGLFDTHSKVVFFDESAEDGIQRNTDEEVAAAFLSGSQPSKKHSRRFRHGK